MVKELMDVKRRWNPLDSGRTSYSRKLESRGCKKRRDLLSVKEDHGLWRDERVQSSVRSPTWARLGPEAETSTISTI